MAKYLLAYHGGGMPESEEEGARVMAAWEAWMGGLGEALADGGNPVGQAVTIASDGASSKGAGANPVTGYSLITAASMDEAITLTKDCPILAGGGSIELCETFDAM